jgi:hypothetical protein
MSEATDKYDGLNLPQLLDLMHEIVEPTPVSWMPVTDGWWVLLGWLLVVCGLGTIKWLSRRRANRYRRASLQSLAGIDLEAAGAAAEVAAIVKRTALAAYPRVEVASLTGPDWAEFLRRTTASDAQVASSAPAIARAAYHEDVRAADIVEPARRWVKLHRA